MARSKAPGGTSTGPARWRTAASTSSNGPSAGPIFSSDEAAQLGAGMKLRRIALGSERISSVTSSWRSPGTCQSKPSGSTWLSTARGTWTVTPSASLPGSNW